jgi:hypothetical protein
MVKGIFWNLIHYLSVIKTPTEKLLTGITESSTCAPLYIYAYSINYHTYPYFIPHMAWNLQIM